MKPKNDLSDPKQRSFMFVFSNLSHDIRPSITSSRSSPSIDEERFEEAKKKLLEELRRTGV